MLSKLEKQHIPLLLLLAMAVSWPLYYIPNHALNDFGRAKSEWWLLIDGLMFLPLVCFICIDDNKQAALKALVYACLMILLGSFLIPEENKVIWSHFESGRFVVLVLFVVFEIITMLTVLFAIKASLNQSIDPDLAISKPIEKLMGKGKLANLMAFEARAWVYALFPRRVVVSRFRGDVHFMGHTKDGTQSHLLGFVVVILLEIPLVHLLLHFIWSPFAANVVTALTVFSLVFFVAEYRAISRRPVSVDFKRQLLIMRYGLFKPTKLPLNEIASFQTNHLPVKRAQAYKRYNLFGEPNVKITDRQGHNYFLGLNNPHSFLDILKNCLS